MSEIPKCLFRIKQLHVLQREGLPAERKRIAIETMFEHKYKSLQFLSKYADPGPKLRDTRTDPLSTNIDENRSREWIEVILNHPVPLVEVLLLLVVVMVDHLRKPMLLLATQNAFLEIGRGFPVEGVVFGVVLGEREDQQAYQQPDKPHGDYILKGYYIKARGICIAKER